MDLPAPQGRGKVPGTDVQEELMRNWGRAVRLIGFTLFLATGWIATGSAQARRPIAALVTPEIYVVMRGALDPDLVVYDDGLVLRRTGSDTFPTKFAATRLSASELTHLSAALAEIYMRAPLDPSYDVSVRCPDPKAGGMSCSSSTDLQTLILYLELPGLSRRIRVYGVGFDSLSKGQTPRGFLDMVDLLNALPTGSAEAWLPDSIEILARPYGGRTNSTVRWPADWPPPASASDSVESRMSLPMASLNAALALWRRASEQTPINYGGEAYLMLVRLPLPGEQLWMRR